MKAWGKEGAAYRDEARREYNLRPVKCNRNGCAQPIPYGRYVKGGKYCSQLCSIQVRAEQNALRANPHPHVPFKTAIWNGKVKQLKP